MYRFLAIPCLVAAGFASAGDLDESEREVWALEEAYYQYALDNDPEGYLSLFSDDVLGWPTMDPLPKGKDKVSQWIAMVHANPDELWRSEIERLAIQSHDDVVVVHYRLREYFLSADDGRELRPAEYRITHTWQKQDGRWQIIAGMGGHFNHAPGAPDPETRTKP